MRTLVFDQIVTNTDKEELSKQFEGRKSRVMNVLNNLNGVKYRISSDRFLDWPDGELQMRVTFYVQKNSFIKWDDVYKAVNSVKAAPYSFESRAEFNP